jgi:hypothetical protein
MRPHNVYSLLQSLSIHYMNYHNLDKYYQVIFYKCQKGNLHSKYHQNKDSFELQLVHRMINMLLLKYHKLHSYYHKEHMYLCYLKTAHQGNLQDNYYLRIQVSQLRKKDRK